MNNTPVQHAPYLLPLQAAAYGLNTFSSGGGLVSLGSPMVGNGMVGAGQLGKLTSLPQAHQAHQAYPGSPLTAVSLASPSMAGLHGLQVASAMGQLPTSQLMSPLGGLYSPLMTPGGLSPYPGVPGSHAGAQLAAGLQGHQVLGPNGMTSLPKLFVPSVKVGMILLASSRNI